MQAAGMDVKRSSHAKLAIESRQQGQNTTIAVEQVGAVLFLLPHVSCNT